MADNQKLTELFPAATLTGDELLYAVQAGGDRQATVNQLTAHATAAVQPQLDQLNEDTMHHEGLLNILEPRVVSAEQAADAATTAAADAQSVATAADTKATAAATAASAADGKAVAAQTTADSAVTAAATADAKASAAATAATAADGKAVAAQATADSAATAAAAADGKAVSAQTSADSKVEKVKDVTGVWLGTKAEYDAVTTKVDTVLYHVKG